MPFRSWKFLLLKRPEGAGFPNDCRPDDGQLLRSQLVGVASLIPYKWVFTPSCTMARVQCLGGPELLLWCQNTQVRGQTHLLGFRCSAWIWGESPSWDSQCLWEHCSQGQILPRCSMHAPVAVWWQPHWLWSSEKNPGGILHSQDRFQLHAVAQISAGAWAATASSFSSLLISLKVRVNVAI